MRTTRSANQLNTYEVVSSWCMDLSGRVQGQESTGVNVSISEENDKLSQQQKPQKVGSLARGSPRTKGATGNCWQEHLQRFQMMMIPEEQLRSECEEAGFVRSVSKGMCYKTGEDVDDGFVNFIASRREYTISRTHSDSEAKLWLHFGPKLIVKFWRVSRKRDRAFPRWKVRRPYSYSSNHQRIWEDLPMNTVADTAAKPKSRNLSVIWYDMSIRENEIQMVQFTGKSLVQSSQSDSKKMEEAVSVTEWINFIWKGSNNRRFQYCQNSCNKRLYIRAIQGHTGGEKIPPGDAGPGPHTSHLEGVCIPSKMFVQFDVHIECWTHRKKARMSWNQTYSVLHTIVSMRYWRRRKKHRKKIVMITRSPEVHCNTGWKHSQNAACWIHLRRHKR